MESRKDLSCFVIEGAEREDEGNYTICVNNPAGEDKAMLFVKIVGECMILQENSGKSAFCILLLLFLILPISDVPDPPENVKCISVGEDTATITWEAPKFDGGAPLKGEIMFLLPLTKTCEVSISYQSPEPLLNTLLCFHRLSHGEEEERLQQVDQAQL